VGTVIRRQGGSGFWLSRSATSIGDPAGLESLLASSDFGSADVGKGNPAAPLAH